MMNGQADPYVRAAINGEVARLAAAEVGERNQTLFRSTAALASLGMREGEIIHHLKPVAEGIGLRGRELYSTIKSGVRTGHSNPRVVSKSQAHDYSAPVSLSPAARSRSCRRARRPIMRGGGRPFLQAVMTAPGRRMTKSADMCFAGTASPSALRSSAKTADS